MNGYVDYQDTMEKSIKDEYTIAIVMPAINEAESIGKVLDELNAELIKERFTIVVVNGRSTDATDEIARKKGVIVINQRNYGYGDALQTGFLFVREHLDVDIIVMMDADLTYDPKDILRIIDPLLENKADMIVGNRIMNIRKEAMPRLNKLGNQILSWLARIILRLKIHDTQSGLRAFWSGLIDEMDLEADGMSLAIEMIARAKLAGARIGELPINYRERIGTTKLNPIKDGIKILVTMVRLMRDTQPFLFFGGIGVILGLAGLWCGLDVTFEWFRTHTIVRLPTVMLSVLLLVGAVQFLTIGLVVDMIKQRKRRKRPAKIGYYETKSKRIDIREK